MSTVMQDVEQFRPVVIGDTYRRVMLDRVMLKSSPVCILSKGAEALCRFNASVKVPVTYSV